LRDRSQATPEDDQHRLDVLGARYRPGAVDQEEGDARDCELVGGRLVGPDVEGVGLASEDLLGQLLVEPGALSATSTTTACSESTA
jgi:hypothetical protein